jgi:hypothetical protein
VLREALIQWIGPGRFADARFQAGVIAGAPGEPQVEIRIAFSPQVLSDPRTPLPPRPNDPPLPFAAPPRKEGASGMPGLPAGPLKDDPQSVEEKKKALDATIVIGPKKPADELKPGEPGAAIAKPAAEQKAEELDSKTLEDSREAIFDAVIKVPEVEKAITTILDPIVDKLPVAVLVAPIPALVAVFAGLRKTHEKFPVPKPPSIKISTGGILFGMDTRVQVTFRGPVDKPTEISASFTLLKSGHSKKIPEGAEINIALTAKFPDSGKPIAADNLAASQSAVFTLTIPLPGDPKAKK